MRLVHWTFLGNKTSRQTPSLTSTVWWRLQANRSFVENLCNGKDIGILSKSVVRATGNSQTQAMDCWNTRQFVKGDKKEGPLQPYESSEGGWDGRRCHEEEGCSGIFKNRRNGTSVSIKHCHNNCGAALCVGNNAFCAPQVMVWWRICMVEKVQTVGRGNELFTLKIFGVSEAWSAPRTLSSRSPRRVHHWVQLLQKSRGI